MMVVFKSIRSGIYGPSIDIATSIVNAVVCNPNKCYAVFQKLIDSYGLEITKKEDVISTIQATLCDIKISLGASEENYMETLLKSKHIKLNPIFLLHNDVPVEERRCQIMLTIKLLHECCHLLTTPLMQMVYQRTFIKLHLKSLVVHGRFAKTIRYLFVVGRTFLW